MQEMTQKEKLQHLSAATIGLQIRAMLGTTANKNEANNKRRDAKMLEKNESSIDRQMLFELDKKTALMNRLLYRLNIGDLHQFL